jgi:hypothetical protein
MFPLPHGVFGVDRLSRNASLHLGPVVRSPLCLVHWMRRGLIGGHLLLLLNLLIELGDLLLRLCARGWNVLIGDGGRSCRVFCVHLSVNPIGGLRLGTALFDLAGATSLRLDLHGCGLVAGHRQFVHRLLQLYSGQNKNLLVGLTCSLELKITRAFCGVGEALRLLLQHLALSNEPVHVGATGLLHVLVLGQEAS